MVFAAVGADAWETDNGGGSWIRVGTPDRVAWGGFPSSKRIRVRCRELRSRHSISGTAMSSCIAPAVAAARPAGAPLPYGNYRCCAVFRNGEARWTAHGRTVVQTASFLCRDEDEVRANMKELRRDRGFCVTRVVRSLDSPDHSKVHQAASHRRS